MAKREYVSGDDYRPRAKVAKAKNGVPTRLTISGHDYALVHKDYINGNKHTAKNKRK